MKPTIKQLEQDVKVAEENLSKAHTALENARIEKSGIKLGDVVVSTRMGDSKDYRVTKVDVSWGNERPWLHGNPRKKDGNFGTAERCLYSDWKKKS